MAKIPNITVNGCELTEAQAKAVNIAISYLQDEVRTASVTALLGRPLACEYGDRLDEVASIIMMGG